VPISRYFLPLVAAMLAGCATGPIPDDEGRAILIGNWYGEFEECKCGDFDFLRWTRMNSPDGAQRIHFRYYQEGKVRQNVIRLGRWEYHAGIYSDTCESYVVDGSPRPCPDSRYDFVVESMTAQAMTYRNDKYHIRYSTRRVADNFRLPD
jgi:hypothetical protein